MHANLEPATRLLEEIEPSTNFYYPPIIDPDLSIMHVFIELHFKFDIQLKETLLELF